MTGLEPGTVTAVTLVMTCYVGALLVIGWRAGRRTHGGEDFHLAGRSLGAWTAGISSTASSESGWVTLGAVGMTYTHGISGLWYAPGCLLGYIVNVYLIAPRLRRLSQDHGSVTITDVITRRWGDPGHIVRVAATAIILLCMMGYVAAQMTSAGKAFSQSLGFSDPQSGYLVGVLIGAAVITLVTLMGGFRAVAWTDLFQGLLVAAALIALPLYAVARLGGFGPLIGELVAVDPQLVTAGGGRLGPALWGYVIGQLGIGLGYPGMPHVVTRYMAARDERQIRRLGTIAMLWGVAVFYGAGLVGLVGRVSLPAMADPEQTLMAMALELLHPALAGLMLAAVISAILSTVSSQLLVAASAVAYDVVEQAFGYRADDRRSLVLGRWTVLVVGVVGTVVALTGARVVFWFVLFAWSGLGAAFAPLVLFAVLGGAVNRHGAFAGMLTGVGVTVVWYLGGQAAGSPAADFGRVGWAVLVCGAVVLLIGRFSRFFSVGHRAAVLAATALAGAAWWLVQQGPMHHVYELVPAFLLAVVAALVVSRLFPAET